MLTILLYVLMLIFRIGTEPGYIYGKRCCISCRRSVIAVTFAVACIRFVINIQTARKTAQLEYSINIKGKEFLPHELCYKL